MKPKTKFTVLLASVFLFIMTFFWLLTTHGPLAPVSVELGHVERIDLSPSVFGIGTVEARLTYAVGPLAPGRVLRVLVDHGDEVKSGDIIAEMDPIDLDRRIQATKTNGVRSKQAVQVAQAQVAEAQSRAKLAKLNRSRDEELFQKHVINKQALDNSTSEAERAQSALTAAKANVEAVKQDIERVDADLFGLANLRDSLRLKSPADGIIISREAEPGTTVVAGQAVLRLVVPSSVWVRTRIDQSRAHDIQIGHTASIVLRSASQTKMPGRVARVDLQSDPITEERIVNISFDTPPEHLYLGELAEVNIQLAKKSQVLVVSSAAIARDGGQIGVWQAVSGRAHFKPVTIGNQGQAGLTEILSGLTEGERIIVHSSAQLNQGSRVREKKVDAK